MKNISFFFAALTTLVITASCKKSAPVNSTNNTINSTNAITQVLPVNGSYQFDLGSFGDEEGASISRQASNFSISEISRENNSGKITYKYVPALNFTGTDEVSLTSYRGSDGASPCNRTINTTIKFTVTN